MSFDVTIAGSTEFAVSAGDSVLAAALRSGIGFPYDCSSGGCGSCRFELLEGTMEDLWPNAPGLSARERSRKRLLACQCRPTSRSVIRVKTSDEYRTKILPTKQLAVLESVADLTHDLREFTFRTNAAAAFIPGQYALVEIPELDSRRAYSMSNLPNSEGIWQFIVRRVIGGRYTSFLFDSLKLGDAISLDAPYGMAWLRDDSPRDIVCIAGGSGLAPMLSIARARSATLRKTDSRLFFYYGGRTSADLAGESQLRSLDGFDERIFYRAALSSSDPAWSGRTGFIHTAVESDLAADIPSFEYYLAGPPAMAEATQTMLILKHSVPISQIHQDRFF